MALTLVAKGKVEASPETKRVSSGSVVASMVHERKVEVAQRQKEAREAEKVALKSSMQGVLAVSAPVGIAPAAAAPTTKAVPDGKGKGSSPAAAHAVKAAPAAVAPHGKALPMAAPYELRPGQVRKPRVEMERSRSQALARTGFKFGGSSKASKYGPSLEITTEDAARAAAWKWLKDKGL